MKLNKLYYFTLITFLISLKGHSQLNASVIGAAQVLDNNCFLITPAVNDQSGGVWYDNPIDFSNDFTIYYQSYFGSNDADGADGMALVIKQNSNPAIGDTGAFIGYGGIDQSLIVEFDTFQNNGGADQGPEAFSDPTYDHIAIMKNGVADHASSSNLAGPIQASDNSVNIEDGVDHEVKIEWISSSQTLKVYFDCNLRLSITEDFKNTIFEGDSSVYFGFVGSTGGLNNIHRVCFNSVSFIENLVLEDETICEGENIQIDASIPSGDSYLWSPEQGVSDINSASPILSPTETTTYIVTVTDICGDPSTQSVTINVTQSDQAPLFDQIDPICFEDVLDPLPNTSIEGVTGTWSPALDNTVSTEYTFTPDDGQCASIAEMTIIVLPLTNPDFTQIDNVCEGTDTWAGGSPFPAASNNGIIGVWTPSFDAYNTTTYNFNPDDGQCASTTEMTIVIIPQTSPDFTQINDTCEGALITLPTISNEGIIGTWSPEINNTITTEYTFTPDPDQCANQTNMTVVINEKVNPVFDSVDTICSGEIITEFPATSLNGITGTWSPALDNTVTTTYTFTPNDGECANPINTTITVLPNTESTFNQLDAICEGESLTLPLTSIEGITGTWLPAIDNTLTTEYTFTPSPNQCASEATMVVTVTPLIIPAFTEIGTICFGDTLSDLPTTSINNITGTWSPAINNTVSTEYTFTSDDGQCALDTTMTITVLEEIEPEFTQIDPICIGQIISPLPQISNNNISGTWTPALNNLETTTYTFTPESGQCSYSTTMTIEVGTFSPISITASNISNDFDSNQIISVAASGGSGNYEFQLDGGSWQSNSIFE
ncbi:MAG: L-type lectin-domain containing protein, partial [Flavobacteriaceae bacterium]|nr:L-type lectin-domain containing protein [Flavobacteriaceae bacterium]